MFFGNVRGFRLNYTALQPRKGALVKELCHKPEGRGFDSLWCYWIFQLTPSFQPHYGPGVDTTSNRNEYQESFWGVKSGRRVRLITSPPSVSRLCRKCGSLDVSQPYGHPRPATRMALSSFYNPEASTPHSHSCENHKYSDTKSVQNTTTVRCFSSIQSTSNVRRNGVNVQI
jgi:hypothetical protein